MTPSKEPARWEWMVFLLVLACTIYVRVRLLDIPLERDEGEYAYSGWLILQGTPPFAESCNMKLPGVYYAYALLMRIFGQTARGVHLGLLAVNLACVFLVVSIGSRQYGRRVGWLAGASFAVLSVSRAVFGVLAHATHFVVFFALAGIWMLQSAIDAGSGGVSARRRSGERLIRMFLSGLCFGASFLMKQHAVFFALFGAAIFAVEARSRRDSLRRVVLGELVLLAGFVLPFAVVCLSLVKEGLFDQFRFWTFTYASRYVDVVPWSRGRMYLVRTLEMQLSSAWPLWLLAGAGLSAPWRGGSARQRSAWLALFLGFSVLTVLPGLYFREHYFITLLPALALCSAVGADSLKGLRFPEIRFARILPTAAWGASILFMLARESAFLFQQTPAGASRTLYGRNPFPESQPIADYIREHSRVGDRIAVLGSEPQICFYARRRSATKYLYMYPLMEPHPFALQMQEEMIVELERTRPAFVVFAQVSTSWLVRPASAQRLFNWTGEWLPKYYKKIGLIDIRTRDVTDYQWGPAASRAIPQSDFFLIVFARRP